MSKDFWNGVGVIVGGALGTAAAIVVLVAFDIDIWSAYRDDGSEIKRLKERIEHLEDPARKP